MDVDEDTIVTPPSDLITVPIGIDSDTIVRYRTATFEPEAAVLPTFVETGPLAPDDLRALPEELVEPPLRPVRPSSAEPEAAVRVAASAAVEASEPSIEPSSGSTTAPSAEPGPFAPRTPGALPDTLPVGYTFRINGQDPVPLDMPTLIGRHPALPRIMRGAPPNLVSLPSPRREVSSTHLELRQQGALVIVTDLRSTNGSTVRMPGRPPVKLGQGESLVVVPGTVIDVGDGNLIEVMPLPGVASDSAGAASGDGGRQR